jgi:very-short-patch-repair endonuclease
MDDIIKIACRKLRQNMTGAETKLWEELKNDKT